MSDPVTRDASRSAVKAPEVLDYFGKSFATRPARRRVISLVPSWTETLFALGLRDEVLAVTEWCTTPADLVATKPKVGGTKNPTVTAIVALRPDLVVANVEENRRADIDRLADAGLDVFVTYPRTVRAAAADVRALGVLVGREVAAEAIALEIERAVAAAASAEPGRRVAYLVWKDPYMAAGGDTYIDDMIRVTGGRNVFAERPGHYMEVSVAEIAGARPDVVVLPSEPYRFTTEDADVLVRELETAGAPGVRVERGDGELLCWYGPRTPAGIRHMGELIR
ncbi:MAG: ABC transporter substrate-binding protein [Myxococcales bacterium]|nr:ABC transporter substrate-binding protein [Myxococcales bacterium]